MEYNEMKELGEKCLADLFQAGQFDEETKRRMIVAFVEGFLRGEIHQLQISIQEA